VTVNGEAVPMETLQGQVLLASGPAVLRGLVEQKLIEQEAARQKVTLSETETKELDKAAQAIKDKTYRQAALEKARVATLARRLLLQGVTEAQIREVYDLYKPELTQYELFAIVLMTHKEGRDLQRSLEDGVHFDILAKNFSIDPSRKNGGKVGFLTLPQIRRSLGQEAADEVARLKPNQVGKTIYTPFGLTVLKVGQVKSDYKDLKPLAESLLAESRRTDLTFRLFQNAKIQSPFMDAAPDSLPTSDEAGIKPGGQAPETLPLPENNGNKPGTELPSVKQATPRAPSHLPGFKDTKSKPMEELPKPEK
jgi:foldase protein PrsA